MFMLCVSLVFRLCSGTSLNN